MPKHVVSFRGRGKTKAYSQVIVAIKYIVSFRYRIDTQVYSQVAVILKHTVVLELWY